MSHTRECSQNSRLQVPLNSTDYDFMNKFMSALVNIALTGLKWAINTVTYSIACNIDRYIFIIQFFLIEI